jgi:hypothetical protein
MFVSLRFGRAKPRRFYSQKGSADAKGGVYRKINRFANVTPFLFCRLKKCHEHIKTIFRKR